VLIKIEKTQGALPKGGGGKHGRKDGSKRVFKNPLSLDQRGVDKNLALRSQVRGDARRNTRSIWPSYAARGGERQPRGREGGGQSKGDDSQVYAGS
jgi:hypothetical protein